MSNLVACLLLALATLAVVIDDRLEQQIINECIKTETVIKNAWGVEVSIYDCDDGKYVMRSL